MKRSHLLGLLRELRARVPLESILIVGSQTAHALATAEIPAVEASLEVDLLLVGEHFAHRPLVQEEFGEESDFFRQHGLFVHAIGLGTVSLPPGWEARLQPLCDENGMILAQAVEIHDTLAAKLMAGRQKDFDFLRELLERNLCDFTTVLDRFLLLRSTPFRNAVPDRLARLAALLRDWNRKDLLPILDRSRTS